MLNPVVTVAALIYRSPAWLCFVLEGLAWSKNKTPFRTLIVGNDAEPQVVATGRLDIDFRNPDPNEYYLNRIYRAWNAAVEAAETDLVVLLNSDMFVSDWWLDELVDAKLAESKALPCSLLVESGRIPSAMPEYVKNFGTMPESFRIDEWRTHAAKLHEVGKGRVEPGRLFMPVLINKRNFIQLGGYPIGNVVRSKDDGTSELISGDLDLFQRYQAAGYRWVTCLGSVCFHSQEGELRG